MLRMLLELLHLQMKFRGSLGLALQLQGIFRSSSNHMYQLQRDYDVPEASARRDALLMTWAFLLGGEEAGT